MTITVCIPAYQAEDFIVETVSSVLGQTHTDLKLVIAIDPPANGSPDKTAEALSDLSGDKRLRVYQNPQRLGWAENCNSLLQYVNTEYFIFLPHDDIWATTYLEILLSALESSPEAAVAYSDTIRFFASPPVRISMTMTPNASRARHLLDFLIQGTEAQVWRGLTRTSSLSVTYGFPIDKHKGFLVECEYALALYLAGSVVHVPRVLYFKRIYEREVVSASRERIMAPLQEKKIAWQVHKKRMQAMLEQAVAEFPLSESEAVLGRTALMAAMMRRYQQFVELVLQPDQLEDIEQLLTETETVDSEVRVKVQANINLVLEKHYLARALEQKANQHAEAAWNADPASAEAQMEFAKFLFRDGQYYEAIERATESMRLSQLKDSREAANLIERIYQQLGWVKTPVAVTKKRSIKAGVWRLLQRCWRLLR